MAPLAAALLIFPAAGTLSAGPGAPGDATPAPAGLHDPFDAILRDHVRDGAVDYRGLKSDEGRLDDYLAALADVEPRALGREERIAFWIDAYNAFTLKLILARYPGIGSIKEIPRGERWKARRWRVDGREYSLDEIEHEILRKMDEPRIHFAIVCASLSCPDLRSEAYVPERLDAQLTAAVRDFLADPEKGLRFGDEPGRLWGTNHVLRLSSIFDWFEEDFERASGSVIDFVLPYAPEAAAAYIRAHRDELRVADLDYDWSLNGR
jgi:hypothetical protein